MHSGRMRVAVVLVSVLALLSPATAAVADEEPPVTPTPAPTGTTEPTPPDPGQETPTVALDATAYRGYLGTSVTVTGSTTDLGTGTVRVARLVGDRWTAWPQATVTTAADRFSARVPVDAASTSIRAEVVDADEVVTASEPATVTGEVAATTLTLAMPTSVKDYETATVTATVATADGRRPAGSVRLMFRKKGAKTWSTYRSIAVTDGTGRATITPRDDGAFELRFGATSTLGASTSNRVTFDNRPPGTVVKIPKGASKPSVKLPAQRRAALPEADAKVSKLSDEVWKSMKGRSWHSGCPVGRGSLRIVRVNYWAFDGYVRRGEIVVHQKYASATSKVFTDLFEARTPIRSMYRVDRFGWSKTLRGANDYTSMRADNTSGFNCRGVVGKPHVRSPHSYGGSIDINPWENPYRSAKGYTPNSTWQKRSSPASITWRGRTDPVVKIFRKHGFRWLGTADLHHFEH